MAAKVLDSVRVNFVESVSLPVIKQLLDDLSRDGDPLNKGEADSITEENPGRADRARTLIDTVVRKGDAASRAMINRLRDRDSRLYAKLGLQEQLKALDKMDLK